MKNRKKNKGQAVVEYLILFAFMGIIGLKFVQALNKTFGESMGNLGNALTAKLTTGVCKEACFFNGFKNLGEE